MPTGYTSCIEKGATFKEFAMGCARAFGHCITMRNESHDAKIPKEFPYSDYHSKALAKIMKDGKILDGLTDKQCEERAMLEYQNRKDELEGGIKRTFDLRSKYDEILLKAKRWHPPSDEHLRFKEFMIEQIESSIDGDCKGTYYIEGLDELKMKTGEEWRKSELARINKDFIYHSKEYEKEKERVDRGNKWISQLRRSFK